MTKDPISKAVLTLKNKLSLYTKEQTKRKKKNYER